jgi:hypothetical protein
MAKAVKARLTGGKLVWTDIFKTAEHASSKTLFDHAFSAICFSPDGKDLYISSGSRTDHGEVKDNEGRYPGLARSGIDVLIFKIPADTENLLFPTTRPHLRLTCTCGAYAMHSASHLQQMAICSA